MSSDNFRNMLPHPKLCLTFMSSRCQPVFYFSDFCGLHWCLLSVLGKITWVVSVCYLLVLIQQHVALPGLNDPCLTVALTFCTFQSTSIRSQWQLYLYLNLRTLAWKSVLWQLLLHVWGDHPAPQAVQMAAAVDGSITVSLLLTGSPLSSCAFSERCAPPACMPSFS